MSDGRFARTLRRAVVVIGLVAGAVVTVGTGTAGADTPTVTITPTTVTDGGTVTVDISGFPTGLRAVGICPRAEVEDPAEPLNLPSDCSLIDFDTNGSRTRYEVTVRDQNTPYLPGPAFTCSALPDGCVLGVATVNSTTLEVLAVAWQPITVLPAATSISVTPTNLAALGAAHVTISGFPSGPGTIGICRAPARDLPPAEAVADCEPLQTFPSGLPTTADVSVPYRFLHDGLVRTCARPVSWFTAFSCVLAVYTTDGLPEPTVTAIRFSPILDITPPPVTATPDRNLDGDSPVTVSAASGLAPGPATVWQCREDPFRFGLVVPSMPGCLRLGSATVGDNGALSAAVVARPSFTDGAGSAYDCNVRDSGAPPYVRQCWIGLTTSDGVGAGTVVSWGATSITAVPQPVIGESAYVYVRVIGFPGRAASVSQCASPVGANLQSSACAPPTAVDLAGGSFLLFPQAVTATFAGPSGPIDCRQQPCSIAGFDAVGNTVASSPLRWSTAAALTLTPSADLHDGEPISVTATGLSPSTAVRVARCVSSPTSARRDCESPLPGSFTPDADGRLTVSVPAAQRLTTGALYYPRRYCRGSGCSIGIIRASDGEVVTSAPYTLATPKVSASPSTGLTDGAAVTVTGTDLEPSYAGPVALFPTGGWGVAQCSRAVLDDPSLIGVFRHCAVPPGGGGVDVPGTTASSTLAVRADITTILGDRVDCAAAPDACVVGMTRWEQDATVTSAFTPVRFG